MRKLHTSYNVYYFVVLLVYMHLVSPGKSIVVYTPLPIKAANNVNPPLNEY